MQEAMFSSFLTSHAMEGIRKEMESIAYRLSLRHNVELGIASSLESQLAGNEEGEEDGAGGENDSDDEGEEEKN